MGLQLGLEELMFLSGQHEPNSSGSKVGMSTGPRPGEILFPSKGEEMKPQLVWVFPCNHGLLHGLAFWSTSELPFVDLTNIYE